MTIEAELLDDQGGGGTNGVPVEVEILPTDSLSARKSVLLAVTQAAADFLANSE